MTNIAIIQTGPFYNDLANSLQKAESLIKDAAKAGAGIVAFGECWLTGYPAWLDYAPNAALWDHEPAKEAWATMYENSIEIPGKDLDTIQQLAKEHKVHVILGANEVVRKGKGNGTLYNTVIQIDKNGNLVNEGEDIHFALWPYVKEMHQIASRHYAHEGRCYVVSIGQMMKASDTPTGIELPQNLTADTNQWVLKGGSCVANPDGSWLLEPQYEKDEIIYVELPSLRENIKERMNLAVSGHYNRPDVFKFKVKR